MPSPLMLGPVAFVGFEIPDRVRFGGRQRLAIHRLPGGRRVIDAMGRDDADIAWAGIFSGPDAADRARMLDALRAGGLPVSLTWDSFLYSVVIARFEADYTSPWWIPYHITCSVVQDEAQPPPETAAVLQSAIGADLGDAAAGLDVSAAVAAVSVDGAGTAGTAAQAAAIAAIEDARARADAGVQAGEAGLSSSDFATAANAAGTVAVLSRARGFVARAGRNLAGAST